MNTLILSLRRFSLAHNGYTTARYRLIGSSRTLSLMEDGSRGAIIWDHDVVKHAPDIRFPSGSRVL